MTERVYPMPSEVLEIHGTIQDAVQGLVEKGHHPEALTRLLTGMVLRGHIAMFGHDQTFEAVNDFRRHLEIAETMDFANQPVAGHA